MEDEFVVLLVQDRGGEGIPAQDIPFVFGKFYRGRNVLHQEGSGLGLYIVHYLMAK